METSLPPRMTFSVFPSSHPPSAFLSPSPAFFPSSDSVANHAAIQEGALVYLLRRKSVLFIVHRCEVPVKVRGARGRPRSDFSSVSVYLHTCPPSRRVCCCCPMLSDVFFFLTVAFPLRLGDAGNSWRLFWQKERGMASRDIWPYPGSKSSWCFRAVPAQGGRECLSETRGAHCTPGFHGLPQSVSSHQEPFSSGPGMRVCVSELAGPLSGSAAVCLPFMINLLAALPLPGPTSLWVFPALRQRPRLPAAWHFVFENCGL